MKDVTLSKKQAQTINDIVVREHISISTLKLHLLHVHGEHTWEGKYEPLNGIPFETLFRAIYCGYNIE
jgi:hypothetical protein